MQTTQAAQNQNISIEVLLYMAAELGVAEWKLAFNGPTKERLVTVPAWDQERLSKEIAKAKAKLCLPADARVLSIQESGRDGFAVHRFFASLGVESLVVDPASIEVPRRQRRAKTDRLDAKRLLLLLRRYDKGEKTALHVLHIPTPEEEDARHPHRERERWVKEKTRLTNRIRSLLVTQGPAPKDVNSKLAARLDKMACWDRSPLPPNLQQAIRVECRLLAVVEEQLAEADAATKAALKAPATTRQAQAVQRLIQVKSIGPQTAQILGNEFFWRTFNNRREVGAAAGLTGTPYNSGKSVIEQGISKAGNIRVRRVLIEAGWLWLSWQPDSALTKWFHERFDGSRRSRRIGIVALARKLLIALWRWVEHGVVPDGAIVEAA